MITLYLALLLVGSGHASPTRGTDYSGATDWTTGYWFWSTEPSATHNDNWWDYRTWFSSGWRCFWSTEPMTTTQWWTTFLSTDKTTTYWTTDWTTEAWTTESWTTDRTTEGWTTEGWTTDYFKWTTPHWTTQHSSTPRPTTPRPTTPRWTTPFWTTSEPETTPPFPSTPQSYYCVDDDSAIPFSWWCDKIVDCPFGDDEEGCGY